MLLRHLRADLEGSRYLAFFHRVKEAAIVNEKTKPLGVPSAEQNRQHHVETKHLLFLDAGGFRVRTTFDLDAQAGVGCFDS